MKGDSLDICGIYGFNKGEMKYSQREQKHQDQMGCHSPLLLPSGHLVWLPMRTYKKIVSFLTQRNALAGRDQNIPEQPNG